MSMIHCDSCGCDIDTDFNTEHDADCLGAEPEEETEETKEPGV